MHVVHALNTPDEKQDDESPEGFVQSLHLLNGPCVELSVESSNQVYQVSVDLLRKKSSYFAMMFQEGRFVKGTEKKAMLAEVDGVVSSQSLKNLLQWIYHDTVSFASRELPQLLSEVLEFLRIADMCDVHGMEVPVTDYMRKALEKSLPSQRANIILPQHVKSAGLLPKCHPFRSLIAQGILRPFIMDAEFPYFDELSQCPSLCSDVLREARDMIKRYCEHLSSEATHKGRVITTFQDPISNDIMRLLNIYRWP